MNALRATEHQLAVLVTDYLGWALGPGSFYCSVPNERRATAGEMAKLIRRGLRPGMPDGLIFNQGRALGLELKTPIGRLSPAQKACHADLERAGVPTIVARSLADVVAGLSGFVTLNDAIDVAGF